MNQFYILMHLKPSKKLHKLEYKKCQDECIHFMNRHAQKSKYLWVVTLLFLCQSISYLSFAQSTFNSYNVVGSATSSGACNIITNASGQIGAAWNLTQINLNNSFDFTFITNQCGTTDGMLFVLQNSGLSAMGAAGGGYLGYYSSGGLFSQSIGIELDIHNNFSGLGDGSDSHIAIVKNGSPTTLAYVNISPALENCVDRFLRIVWSNTDKNLSVYLDGILKFTYPIDIVSSIFGGNPNVYFGFVGATGGGGSIQRFCNQNLIYSSSSSSITTSVLPINSFCAGTATHVPFTATGSFNADNIFTAQLSDASGSFTSLTDIGMLNGTTSGTINATIPVNTPAGTRYRIRVVSSDPAVTGTDNGNNLRVNPLPTATLSGNGTICTGGSTNLNVFLATGTPPWSFTYTDGTTPVTITNITTLTYSFPVSPSSTKTYTLTAVSDANCSGTVSGGPAIVTVNIPPVLTVPTIATVNTEAGKCGATVAFAASATGTPAPAITYKIGETGITSPYFFPVGTTTVTAIAANICGTDTKTFNVIVQDVTPPTITCPSPITVNNDANNCGANVTIPTNGSLSSCLSGWNLSVPIQINSANSSALTDYQVKIVLNTQQLINAGLMKSDAGDMRFTGADCSILSYWIESGINTINTVVWVKIPAIPANSSTAINLNYGNVHAVSASNGPSTFIVFDDFEDGNTNGWTFGSGTWTITNLAGNRRLHSINPGLGNGSAAIFASTLPVDEYIVETDYYPVNGSSYGGPVFEFNDFSNYYAVHSMANTDEVMHSRIQNGGADYSLTWNYPHNNVQWFNFRVERSTVNNRIYFNHAFIASLSRVFSNGAGVWNYGDQSYFDNFRVRKYASSIPTVTVGASTSGFSVSDNCSIATITNSFNNSSNASGFYPIGTTTVTWTVTDVAGNASTCQQTVTVNDNQAPTVVTQNITVQLDAHGTATITPAQINNGSTDNCSIAEDGYSLSKTSFDCSNVGANEVTLTVTDVNGNSDSKTAIVTVEDKIVPVAQAKNITLQLDATGNATITAEDIDNGSSDGCGIKSLVLDKTSFSCADVGTNIVTLTVTDNNGNVASTTATVTVEDKVKPTITAPPTVNATTNSACTAINVILGTPVTEDNCAVASVTNDSPAAFPLGSTIVIWTITDANGNTQTSTQEVFVTDNTPPVLSAAPANITVYTGASATACTATATWAALTATDNCSGTVTVSPNYEPGAAFQVGTTIVIYTATDAAGNTSEESFTVTVIDNTTPTITAPAAIIRNTDVGKCEASNVALGTPIFSDNCSGATVSNNAPSVFAKGTTTITWTVTDAAGNKATATQEVTVEDKENPMVSALADITKVNDAGSCGAIVNFTLPTATDNCPGATVTKTDNTGLGSSSVFPVGTTYLEYTASDAAGNTAITSFSITITNADPVLSAITAPASPVQVNTSVAASASFTDTNLKIASWNWGDGKASAGTISGSGISGNHSYTTPGVYIVTLTVEDACGKTATSEFRYVVIYDPNGGFVTGGGWINSPAGAYAANPTATGKANFGFVSKYQKGATIPTGNTNFLFTAVDFEFNSTSYEWLVIAGARAQYKGEGTINGVGVGGYGFLLSAIDGQVSGGGGVDKFRIKIWSKATNQVVYDNNMGSADNADPTTAIGGGSIVVHDGKTNAREDFATSNRAEGTARITAYPNPVEDKLTIDLGGLSAVGVTTILTDAVGKAVLEDAHKIVGESLLEVEMSSLQSGLYLIQLRSEHTYQIIKVLKQ